MRTILVVGIEQIAQLLVANDACGFNIQGVKCCGSFEITGAELKFGWV